MNQILRFTKIHALIIYCLVMVPFLYLAHSYPVYAFNNNNGRNLPFCDTTQTPSWDPPGVWYEWCGRRWFVSDNSPQKTSGNSYGLSRNFYLKKNQQGQLKKNYQEAVTRQIQEFSRHRLSKRTARHDSDIEITYQDMISAYTYNSDFVENYAYPENLMMDMGIEDPEFTAPQHWTLPAGLTFSTLERKILDPKTTPHADSAPEATHCLYVKSPNRGMDIYEYYRLDEDGLWFAGEEVEDLDYSDYTEDEIMTLPLDYYTDYQSGSGEEEDWRADGDTTWYSDTDYEVDAWYYWSEAYGTLDTPDDGPVEVIKIAYQWIWSQWEVDEESENGEDICVGLDNGTEIYFYSKDGHQLMITIDSLGVETTGLVKPDYVYYQKVRKPGSSVDGNQSITVPSFSFFPNPTQGVIRFSSPTSIEVFDVLGRRVFSRQSTALADLSHLPRGIYFIRPQNGIIQKLIIQK